MSLSVPAIGYSLSPSFFVDDTNPDLGCVQKVDALFRTYSCRSLPNSDPYYLCGLQRTSPFVPGCECSFSPGKNTTPFNPHKQDRGAFNKRIYQLRGFPSKEPFPASTASLKEDLSSSDEVILLVGLCSADEEAEIRHLLADFSVQSIVEKPNSRAGLNALSLPSASHEEKFDFMNKKLKVEKRFTRLKRSRN